MDRRGFFSFLPALAAVPALAAASQSKDELLEEVKTEVLAKNPVLNVIPEKTVYKSNRSEKYKEIELTLKGFPHITEHVEKLVYELSKDYFKEKRLDGFLISGCYVPDGTSKILLRQVVEAVLYGDSFSEIINPSKILGYSHGNGYWSRTDAPQIHLNVLPKETIYKVATTKGKIIHYQQSNQGPNLSLLVDHDVKWDVENENNVIVFEPNKILHLAAACNTSIDIYGISQIAKFDDYKIMKSVIETLFKQIESKFMEHGNVKGETYHITKTFIIEADKPNLNNRIYTKEAIENAAKDYNTRLSGDGVAWNSYWTIDDLGCLGMPEGMVIPLDKLSHQVEKLYIEDNKVYADIKILQTPSGLALKSLLDNKVRVDFRWACTTNDYANYNGTQYVHGFSISSINAVQNGS